jgi:hypothetical protein
MFLGQAHDLHLKSLLPIRQGLGLVVKGAAIEL